MRGKTDGAKAIFMMFGTFFLREAMARKAAKSSVSGAIDVTRAPGELPRPSLFDPN